MGVTTDGVSYNVPVLMTPDLKKYRCYCFRNEVTVGVEGSVKKMEIRCSEVNVMVQEDMMNRSFLHDKEKAYRYSFMCQV